MNDHAGVAAEGEVDEGLLGLELVGEVLAAFRRLSERCRVLLRLVCADPPLSYAEVGARLGKSTGYVGPTRARCLASLRDHHAENGQVSAS